MVTNTQVIFSKVPTGYPAAGEHMTINKSTIDLDAKLSKGEFIMKQLSLSVDPYMRGRMRDASTKSYVPAFELGKPMTGGTMSIVIKSNNPHFKVGDIVDGGVGAGVFEEYTLVTPESAKHLKIRNDPKENGLPLDYYLGVLGMPGMTAYVG